MDGFKDLINFITRPTLMLTFAMFSFPFFFPVNDWFDKWNKRLRLNFLWTKGGLITVMLGLVLFFFGRPGR